MTTQPMNVLVSVNVKSSILRGVNAPYKQANVLVDVPSLTDDQREYFAAYLSGDFDFTKRSTEGFGPGEVPEPTTRGLLEMIDARSPGDKNHRQQLKAGTRISQLLAYGMEYGDDSIKASILAGAMDEKAIIILMTNQAFAHIDPLFERFNFLTDAEVLEKAILHEGTVTRDKAAKREAKEVEQPLVDKLLAFGATVKFEQALYMVNGKKVSAYPYLHATLAFGHLKLLRRYKTPVADEFFPYKAKDGLDTMVAPATSTEEEA